MSSDAFSQQQHGPSAAGTPTLAWDGAVANITLNRATQHNRFERRDIEVLGDLLTEIEAEPGARVLVVTASGTTFSSGYDLGALTEEAGTGSPLAFAALCDRLEDFRHPTICGLNGSVYGGATDFALACDFRIGVAGIRMRMPASRLGLHYYHGGIRRYVERLGLGAAKRLFLTADEIDASSMLRIGFLDELVTPGSLEDSVATLAKTLAGRAPLAVQGMKASLNAVARGTDDPGLVDARFTASLASDDAAEGLRAWSEKRDPHFRDC